jgi:pimeloyl-ACP methyl ester carboxylesterase
VTREQAVRFGAWRSLAGVVADPVAGTERAGAPAVLFLNAGLLHHVGPHRIYVELARRWSALGVKSLRFDVSGCGDSGVRQDRLGRVEALVQETREAMDFMEAAHGVKRFVLFGICTGADQALRTARVDPRVEGAVLLDGYTYSTVGNTLRYYAGRAVRLRTWWHVVSRQHPALARKHERENGGTSLTHAEMVLSSSSLGLYVPPPRQEAEAWIREVLDRGCQLCFVFTKSHRFSGRTQFGEMYPSLAKDPRPRLELLTNTDHVFTLRASQEMVMATADAWLREVILMDQGLRKPHPALGIPT